VQAYSDPSRASDPHALLDVEVFFLHPGEWATSPDAADADDDAHLPSGWYWQSCFVGCLPDGEPNGPFDSEADALADAQGGAS
jgi:hypothetical protein